MNNSGIDTRNNYNIWEINLSDFPKNDLIEKKIKFILKFGILSPSTHNSQPWLFKISKKILLIRPDWRYRLPAADPNNQNLFISIGCCITNILSAASYFGFSTQFSLEGSNEQNTVLKICFNSKLENSNKDYGFLCPSISQRYSNKLPYLTKSIEKEKINKLQKIKINKTIDILLTENKNIIHEISILHENAIKNLSSNKLFRKELASWLRPNNTSLEDGMPGFVGGLKPLQTLIGIKLIPKIPSFMKILAKKDKELIASSPMIGIITAEDSKITTWIDIGRTYELIALYATFLGISIAPMHALVEDKELSKKVKNLLKIKKKEFYMFFRLGISTNNSYHTPRRSLEKFFS